MEIVVRNRHRKWRVATPLLREVARSLLADDLCQPGAVLGIQLVNARAMEGLNRRWLSHEGSTDILTFDHRAGSEEPLHGELYISLDDAELQAGQFRTTPALELVRYVVHGVLHLCGHSDLEPSPRRAMKREEGRWLRRLAKRFPVERLLEKRDPAPRARR